MITLPLAPPPPPLKPASLFSFEEDIVDIGERWYGGFVLRHVTNWGYTVPVTNKNFCWLHEARKNSTRAGDTELISTVL